MKYLFLFLLIAVACEAQMVEPAVVGFNRYTQPYSVESQAVITKIEAAGTMTEKEKRAVQKFVDSQVMAGNWGKMYVLIPLRGFDTQAKSLINWISGVSATTVNSPTWSKTLGITTNGTNQYVNTQWIPSTGGFGGASVPLNTITYVNQVTDVVNSATGGTMGSTVNAEAAFILDPSTSPPTMSMKHHTSNSAQNLSTRWVRDDLYITNRRVSSSIHTINLNTQFISSSSTYNSVAVPNRAYYIGAWNNNGTAILFGNGSYGVFMAYQELVGFDPQKFYVDFKFLMEELGADTKSGLFPYDRTASTYNTSDNLVINAEGQSNSLFAGIATGPPVAPLNTTIPKVKTLWAASGVVGNPVTLDPLLYGTNHSYNNLGLFAGGMRAMFDLQRLLPRPKIVLWEYCISATYLNNGGNPNWDPATTGTTNGMWRNSNILIWGTGSAVSGPIKKMIWHWNQGEGDAGLGRTTAQYTADLYAMLKAKIDYLETQGMNFSKTELHIVTPVIWIDFAGGSDIRAAQNAFSIANFDAAYPGYGARVKSWSVYKNDDLLHDDGTHMNFDGYYIEGMRLAIYFSKI